MDVIKEMLFKALRDDSTASVGLQALLSQTTTPYGVYHAQLPENFDFSSNKKYVTYYQLTGEFDTSFPRGNFSTIAKQETYQITAWGGDATTSNDKILDRIRYLLEGKHRTTNPLTGAMVFAIKCEWEGPDLWDEDYKIFYRAARFRVWIQDYTIENNTTGFGLTKNLLKGIQATFSDWDTSPTALNLTNEDFSDDNATIGIKTAGAYTTLGTIIFDLGAEYTNVLINGGGIISAENAVFINLSCSADGITYDAYFPVYDAGDSGNHDFGFRWHSLDGRYIKIIFTSGANPASTLFTITFYGFAAMQYK